MRYQATPSQASRQTPYTVLLKSCGNPDHRQDPNVAISVPDVVHVDSLRAASVQCMSYIDDNDLGAGNWSGGQVLLDGKPFAYVSYNGRIWGPDVQSDSKSKSFHGNDVEFPLEK